MSTQENVNAARKAKRLLEEKYRGAAWLHGIGITPSDDGLAIRLNVDPDTGPDPAEFPTECDGVRIEV